MQVNRGLVFWGVALITAGGMALAIQAGAVAGETARQLWEFWPVALIVIGLAVIAARTPLALIATLGAGIVVGGLVGSLVAGWPEGLNVGCGGDADEIVTDSGTFGASAEVELDFDCGDLAVATTAGSGWDVDAGYAGDSEPQISSDDGSLRVTAEDGGGIFGIAESRQDWNVTLPTDTDLALGVDVNAASSTFDLDDASFTSLGIDANAGDVEVRLPGASVGELSIEANAGSISIEADDATTLTGSVEMNAGAMDVCVPDGVSIAITVEEGNITFDHNLDESGLTREGDTWRSGSGDAAVTLQLDANAASFTLNPDGGCS